MKHVAVVASLVTMAAAAGVAWAQSDTASMAHAAVANQLGVMEYCQGRGDVGADAVAAERSAMARLPASTGSFDAQEAEGKQGTFAMPNGSTMTLQSMASTKGVDVSAVCKQMVSAAVQSAAMMQQNGMAPGAMPALPPGVAMPSGMTMPNGMTAPTAPDAPPH